MKISGCSKLIFAGTVCSCFFISIKLIGQTENVQPKFKQVFVYIPKTKVAKTPQINYPFIIDSLKTVIQKYDTACHNELSQSTQKDSVIDELNRKILGQQPVINDLQSRVSKYQDLNEQTKKNNFILLVFNSVVSFLLLLMLIRYILILRKKKKYSSQKHLAVSSTEIAHSDLPKEQIKTGYSLEQLDKLEKIGKLRNTGILTEEEFILQKQLILKN